MREQLEISVKHCTIEKERHILIVTLNRPDAKNALSMAMLIGMYRAWRLLDEDDDLYCAVLTGKGEAFCTGMDLKLLSAAGEGEDWDEMQKVMVEVPNLHCQSLLQDNRPHKPIISAVEGYAMAAGAVTLLGTDIRVCAEDSVLGMNEVTRGIYPMGGATVRLRRQIPYCLAVEMLLLGQHVSAQQALEWGLINRVVPKGQALQNAVEIAEQLCEHSPLAIKGIIRSLRELDESVPEAEAMRIQDEIGFSILSSEDAKEGMKAFKEKRKPVYKGR